MVILAVNLISEVEARSLSFSSSSSSKSSSKSSPTIFSFLLAHPFLLMHARTNLTSPGTPATLCFCAFPPQCVRERGWLVAKKGDHWDIGISDNNQTVKLLEKMRTHPRTLVPTQRINHFPDMRQIYNKAYLAKNVNALQDAMDGEVSKQ